jgi:hypothetical protein
MRLQGNLPKLLLLLLITIIILVCSYAGLERSGAGSKSRAGDENKIVSRNGAALGSTHAHYYPDYPDPSADRGFSRLGLQFGMGLLSVWRNRAPVADRAHSRSDQQDVSRRRLAAKLQIPSSKLRRPHGRSGYRLLVSARFKAVDDSEVLRFRAEKSRALSNLNIQSWVKVFIATR